MSLSVAQSLERLALAQALLVAPALGESYTGKTAGTIAALLLILADAMVELPSRRLAARQKLLCLLASARVGDPALAADIERLLAEPDEGPWMARDALLMGAFTEMHRWADAHDAALAARCRDWLADWATGEKLAPPRLPG
jgi:hypothetical protein